MTAAEIRTSYEEFMAEMVKDAPACAKDRTKAMQYVMTLFSKYLEVHVEIAAQLADLNERLSQPKVQP